MLLTPREEQALECCRTCLPKVYPDGNPDGYVVASALMEFLGGTKGGYHLMGLPPEQGQHYWVANELGAALDPMKLVSYPNGGKPPYRHGRKVSKRNTIKKHLPIIEAMKETLNGRGIQQDKKSVDVFGRPLVVEKGAAISDEQQARLSEAWRSLFVEWASRPDELIRCFFPKGALAVHFVRAMLYGDEIPRYATMAYVPDRYYVAGSAYPFNEMLPQAVKKSNVLRGVRFALGDELSFTKLIASNLPIGGYRIPNDFPISLARDLINKYCPEGGTVLDPCHGWGGRLVGFMLSHASQYVGVDPAPHSYKLQEMFDDLEQYLFDEKQIKLINKPFEDVALRESGYDFAITSPPYYNTEKYMGENSSWRRYQTLDQWIDGFYRPLIVGVADSLKPGAAFALQITPKFKMPEVAKQIGHEVGLEFERVADTSMRRYNSITADSAGSTDLFEVVAIFRKKP